MEMWRRPRQVLPFQCIIWADWRQRYQLKFETRPRYTNRYVFVFILPLWPERHSHSVYPVFRFTQCPIPLSEPSKFHIERTGRSVKCAVRSYSFAWYLSFSPFQRYPLGRTPDIALLFQYISTRYSGLPICLLSFSGGFLTEASSLPRFTFCVCDTERCARLSRKRTDSGVRSEIA